MPPNDFITYGGVGVSESMLWKSDGKRKTVDLKREGTTVCELHYGSPEERPLVSAILGGALMIPGAWFFAVYFSEGGYIGFSKLRYVLAMLLFFGLGLWLVYQALGRRNYYLRVSRNGAARKLVFASKEGLSNVYAFLEEAGLRFGLTYEDRVPAWHAGKRAGPVVTSSSARGPHH